MPKMKSFIPTDHKAICDKCFPGLRAMMKNRIKARAQEGAQKFEKAGTHGEMLELSQGGESLASSGAIP